MEDLDEPLGEVAVARDPDSSALDGLARAELAGHQGPKRQVRIDSKVGVGERPFGYLEGSLVDGRVQDDLAEVELVARP